MAQTKTSRQTVSSRARQKALVSRVSKKPKMSKKLGRGFTDLKLKIAPILKPYASRISVFGSFARGEATASSDIDLLIALKPAEMRPVLGLFEFVRIEQALEKKLGCEVDLVTEEGINPRRKKNIEKDRVVLYEEK